MRDYVLATRQILAPVITIDQKLLTCFPLFRFLLISTQDNILMSRNKAGLPIK
jgi:hypothetical protein